MRRILPPLLFFTFLCVSPSVFSAGRGDSADYQSEFYRTGKPKVEWVINSSDESAIRKEYFREGQIKSTGTYRDDKRDGRYQEFYESGQLAMEVVYNAGIPVGTYRSFFPGGQIKSEGYYREGELDGIVKAYHPNGLVKEETVYSSGKANGVSRSFYEDGSVRSVVSYVDGLREGRFFTYERNGVLISQGTFLQDQLEGLGLFYYPSGALHLKIVYRKGQPQGEILEYSEQGVLLQTDQAVRQVPAEPVVPARKTSFGERFPVLSYLIFDASPNLRFLQIVVVFCLAWMSRGFLEENIYKLRKVDSRQMKSSSAKDSGPKLEALARELNPLHPESHQLYRRLIETVDTGFFLTDRNGRIKYSNFALVRILGYDTQIKVQGIDLRKEFQEMTTEGDGFWLKLARERSVKDYQLKRQGVDGTVRIFSFSGYQILNDQGEPVGIEGVVTDTTEKQRLAEALMVEKNKLESILVFHERVDVVRSVEELACFTVQEVARILDCQRCSMMLQLENSDIMRIVAACGLPDEIVTTTQVSLGDPIAGYFASSGKPILVKNIEYDQNFSRANCPHYLGRSFMIVPFRLRNQCVGVINVTDKVGAGGEVETFTETDLKILVILTAKIATAIDNITTLNSLNLLTVTDPMTQMFNYRRFLESLEHEIASEKRNPSALSIAMIDMDYFKKYNDTFGHLEGDALLRTFGQILRKELRESDIICRYAGDEFCVVFPGTTSEGARNAAEKLRAYVDGYAFKSKITLSIGIAQYTAGMTIKDFIQKADQALYEAKHAGRNRVVVQA